jgi:hypothetical protein
MRFSWRATMRLAIVCAALVGGLLGSGVASAQPASNQQSAVSPFFNATGLPIFFGNFNAVSDAGGTNATGQVSYRVGGPGEGYNVSADVVCLSVTGNTAVIRGEWSESSSSLITGLPSRAWTPSALLTATQAVACPTARRLAPFNRAKCSGT